MRVVAGGWAEHLVAERARRQAANQTRALRPLRREGSHLITSEGGRLLDLSSNDYLGLSHHPALAEAAAQGAREGAGATASRLVVGTTPGVAALEQRLADFQGREAALLVGSGYLANVGVIPALVGAGDAIVCDRLDHASTWDGARISGAKLYRFAHGRPDALEEGLRRARSRGARRILVAVESVFSMDGDLAALHDIVDIKERYDALLLVDEAHADGVFGPGGRGLAHASGLADRVDVHLGTFSKAFGCYGAFLAADRILIDHLVNTMRSVIFTTGLAPSLVATIGEALTLVEQADDLRDRVTRLADGFRESLTKGGVDTCRSASQIVPALVGASDDALALSAALEREGFLAVAIRPPTVPSGTARLRFAISALHEESELVRVAALVAGLLRDR